MIQAKAYINKEKDGSYSIYLDEKSDIPYGLIGEGASVGEAIAEWNNVYAAMKEGYEEEKRPFPEAEFTFVYDVASFLAYYGNLLTFKGLSKLTGVSAAQLSQYASGYRSPSPKTTAKIQAGIKALADDLSQVVLC